MDKTNLIQILKPFVKKGNFTLSSLMQTDVYFDLKEAYGKPEILNSLADSVYEIIDKKATCVAAKGFGGIPLATAISLRHCLNLTLMRDKPKDYRTKKFIEAYIPTKDDKIAIVDDVFTTGKNLREAIEILETTKGNILGCYVVVKRGEGELNYPLSYVINLEKLL